MIEHLLESMRVVALPTRTNFRGINLREVALFQGPQGWSEFSPFLEYDDNEAARWLACAIEAATTPLPKLFRDSVKVNGTIPALNDLAKIKEIVDRFPGCTTFKIKVGDNLEEDLARVSHMRAIRPDANLRIDVNGGWSVDQAVKNIDAIQSAVGPLQYAEQPCESVEELRELKSRVDITIAGDEVLRKAEDPFAVKLEGAVDILMLKVQPLGGIKNAHALAEHHKLPVVVSSALESAVGINYGLKLAASFENELLASGLATGSLLASNVAELPIIDGEIRIAEFTPDIDGYEVAPDRYQWWKNRVMRTAALLA
jgi:O-succinylbenzoate synthase